MALVLRRGRMVDEASPEQPPRLRTPGTDRRRFARTLLVIALPAFVGAAAAFALDKATDDHLFPGTRIGGVQLGGTSLTEAEDRLTGALVEPLHEPMLLEAAGARVTLTPWELGMRVDVARVLRETHARQQSSSPLERMWKRISGDRANVALDRYIEEGTLQRSLDETVRRVNRPVRDAALEVSDDGVLRVVPDEFGREVDVQNASIRIVEALQADARRVELPVHVTHPERTAADFHKVILIKTRANTLDLYEDGVIVRSYRVATGTGGYPTPKGQFSITAMRRNPGWGNPGSPWAANMPAYIPPGLYNPLGTRAMNLSVSGIRIHGTPLAYTIGRNASHGCIRMLMSDAEELFDMVGVGTPVLIIRA